MTQRSDFDPSTGAGEELSHGEPMAPAEASAEPYLTAPAPPPPEALTAPAPPPPFGMAQRDAGGFDPKGHRVLVEIGVLVSVVALLGVLAVWGGGRLAALLTPVVPIEVDTKIGSLASGQMSALAPECKNPLAKKYVEDIARPLLEAAQPLPFEFHFRVAQDEMVNAFALPGGYVTVNYGLLKKSETGEEVAGVIGHEIQHALLRHGTKRILRELGGSIALSLILGGSDLHEVGQVASQVTGLSYDRDQESEADLRGVDLMLRSGIDPSGLAVFFERLAKDSATPPELMSTHPDPGNRAERIRAAKLTRERFHLPTPRGVPCD